MKLKHSYPLSQFRFFLRSIRKTTAKCSNPSILRDYYDKSSLILDELQKKYEVSEELLAELYVEEASFFLENRLNEEALEYNNKAVPILKSLGKKKEGALASVYNNIGVSNHRMKEYGPALSFFYKSIKLNEKLFKKAPNIYRENLAKAYNNLGAVYTIMNKPLLAKICFNKSKLLTAVCE